MKEIVERLAKHVADFGVMYVKMHNYHWHVCGSDFQTAHAMTEEYYEEIAEFFDSIAERILQLGEKAPASLKEYSSLSGIKEEEKKCFNSMDVAGAIKSDFEYLLKELHVTQKMAGDAGDCTTDGIISGIIEKLEKYVWMLGATLKK